MKTVYVKYYDPSEVMEGNINTLPKKEVLEYCFRVAHYATEADALMAYANTMCTWSTLLEDSANVEWFIDCAYDALKSHNYDWLEENFT